MKAQVEKDEGPSGEGRSPRVEKDEFRSKDFAFDVSMMPYDHDVLMPYENALLKFNSRKKFKNTRYNIKKISSVFRKGIPN